MKSDIIMIDNQGNGLDNALKETKKRPLTVSLTPARRFSCSF